MAATGHSIKPPCPLPSVSVQIRLNRLQIQDRILPESHEKYLHFTFLDNLEVEEFVPSVHDQCSSRLAGALIAQSHLHSRKI